jgi:ABC-type dipeptide/oligopeptide/nickel transport system permease component
MLDVMSQDDIRTARTKGLPKWKLVLRAQYGDAAWARQR